MKSIDISVAETLVQWRGGDCVVNHLNTATTSKKHAFVCVCVFCRMVWASLAALTVCCSAHSCPVGGGVARKAPTTSDVSIPVIWRDIQISLKTCRFKELVGGGGSRAHFSLQRSSSGIKGPQSAQVSVIFTMCLYGVVS